MDPRIEILMNNKCFSFSLDTNNVLPKGFCVSNYKKININKLSQISITEKNIITVKADLDFTPTTVHTPLRTQNNIDAYDWDGNHLWNISEIVGALKIPFMGGYLWTDSFYKETLTRDLLRDINEISNYIEGHILYSAITDRKGYVIDLDDRKVICTYPVR